MKSKFCVDCNKKLGKDAFFFNTKRCRSCSKKGIRPDQSKRMLGINNPNYKIGLPKCSDCGKKLSVYGIKRCWDCYCIWSKIPTNNSNWNGGISKEGYSFEFTEKLKDSIRTRDNYICKNPECNMTEEEHLIVYGKTLDIHHIDYNKKNCQESNLITTCHQCNIRANYNRNYWKDFYSAKILTIKEKEQ